MAVCPECLSTVTDEALVCAACGRRIKGKQCPECAELSKQGARKCQYCGHSFAREERVSRFEPYRTKAALFPTLFLRGRLIPQEIHLTPDKIVIRSWGFFWLSRTDEESPWEKIAGYHYHSGWFWDGVEIQTRGQRASIITCLPKPSAAHIKRILEQMKE